MLSTIIRHHSSQILPFLILLLFIQQCSASPIVPSQEEEVQSTEKPTSPGQPLTMKALKMRGPDPLGPGQKGTIKTDYFDPKTYSTKDLRDFHRLTQGLNADIRRMVEETERIRQKSAADAEELERLKRWALQDQRQWWLLLLTGSAMAVALLAMALANLLLARAAVCNKNGNNHNESTHQLKKAAALLDEA